MSDSFINQTLTFFKSLNNQKEQKEITPIVLHLSISTHSMFVGYRPKVGWFVFRAHETGKGITQVKNEKELVNEIFAEFGGKTRLSFKTKLYSIKNQAVTANKVYQTLTSSKLWKRIHDIPDKAYMADNNGMSLMYWNPWGQA